MDPAAITPLTLGDIFDRLFKLTGSTIARNAAIAGVILGPATLLLAFGSQTFFASFADIIEAVREDGEFSPGIILDMIGRWSVYGFSLLVISVAALAVTVAVTIVACSQFEGKRREWTDALSDAFGIRLLRAIGQSLLMGLAIGVLILIPYLGLIAAAVAGEGAALIALVIFAMLFLAVIPFAVYLYIKWAFAIPAIAWENAGVIKSFQRSWELVTDNWWRVFGILILLNLIVQFALSIVTTPLLFVAMWDFFIEYFKMLGTLGDAPPAADAFMKIFSSIGFGVGLVTGISTLLQVLITPLISVVMYYDLRARRGEFPQIPVIEPPPAL
jgi:hypothetical protein